VLKTNPGVGRILALTILYEVGDIQCFEPIRKFTSYARLQKCKDESAGKRYVEKLQKRMNRSKVL
jgi:transposase